MSKTVVQINCRNGHSIGYTENGVTYCSQCGITQPKKVRGKRMRGNADVDRWFFGSVLTKGDLSNG